MRRDERTEVVQLLRVERRERMTTVPKKIDSMLASVAGSEPTADVPSSEVDSTRS
jgi:hypothetical protein